MQYPVLEILNALKTALDQHRIVILQAPPGAGKSTILPLELLEADWLSDQKIIMLEPRRLAAKSVAQRMASLRKEEVGNTVGYRVRFDTKLSAQTKLEVVTEGILTRMIQSDNSLDGIGLVIFDEFHERSLQADLALALCLQVQQVLRTDLRILIMSATLDADQLKKSLGNVPVITSEGRQFPVSVRYLNQKEEEPLAQRMSTAVKKAVREETGDVLVFLPGAGEIQRTAELLEQLTLGVKIHTLYADLSYKEQEQALLPNGDGQRKVVLATSIAETSLTIEGIKVVIDSGYARVPRFDVRSGLTRLETIRVTKDAADQRKGRAGRLGPGICYRLWSENASLVAQRKPEILEADLAPLVLELFQWGVKNPSELSWITSPPSGAWKQAKELLEQLGAIENDAISAKGKQLLKLPTHPRIANMLTSPSLASPHPFGTTLSQGKREGSEVSLACDLAAVIEERDPLQKESGADVALRIEALHKFRKRDRFFADRIILSRIEKMAAQWRKILKCEVDNNEVNDHSIGILLLTAYPERVAQQIEKHGDRYKMANGKVVKLPAHDSLAREPWLCIAQLDAGNKEGKIFLAAAVDVHMLKEKAIENENVFWDEEREMVVSFKDLSIGGLILERKPIVKPEAQQVTKIIIETVQGKGLKFIGWNEEHSNWQARVQTVKVWRPAEAWPLVDDESLIQTLDQWFAPYLDTLYKRSELVKLDLLTILQSSLPWELSQKLDALAPQKLVVPSGSLIDLHYFSDGRPPVMEVRLQEMFGLLDTPTVNVGRNKIMLHLLSPGYKPVQVTQDLKSFWQTTYHEVRKELRMRYPKHHWPEDPWTAEAVKGVKKNYKQ